MALYVHEQSGGPPKLMDALPTWKVGDLTPHLDIPCAAATRVVLPTDHED